MHTSTVFTPLGENYLCVPQVVLVLLHYIFFRSVLCIISMMAV